MAAVKKRPSLKLVLLAVNLIILAMPISGLYLFRIYENELVRQTEMELIAQAALTAAMFKAETLRLGGPNYGRKMAGMPDFDANPYRLIPPSLDLSRDPVLPENLSYRSSPYDSEPVASEAAASIKPVLVEAERTNLSSITILDFRGLVVSGWRGRGHGLSLADNEEVAAALNGRDASVLRSRPSKGWVSPFSPKRGARFRVCVAMPIMNQDRLVGVVYLARTPREVIMALCNQEWPNLAMAAGVVLSLMVVVSLITSFLIISPIKHLSQEATAVAEGFSQTLKVKPPFIAVREFADLRAAVAEMANRLAKRSDYLKAFAAGVSHEFKTPLTSLKGAMELIGEHGDEMDAATRTRFENNIRSDLDRLELLVMRLLALARAEAINPDGREKADAVLMARKTAGLYGEPDFSVAVVTGHESLVAGVSPEVLETVLKNLCDNSRQNGAGSVAITLSLDDDSEMVCLTLADDGPGIPDEAAEAIFTPFFTTRKNTGGTGLGLSLARTLLSPYRGELIWQGNDPGAVFMITLPLAPEV